MKPRLIILFCIYLLLSGCQKRKYPEDSVQLEKEAIYFSGYFGDQPISLKIGSDGYYCYSSYKQSVDSVYTFSGELRKFNCNPCPLSFRLELSDYRQRAPGASVPVDSVLKTGTRKFLPAMPRINTFSLMPVSNKAIASCHWETSEGESSNDAVFNCGFVQAGPQTVSLTVRAIDNSQSTVVNKLFMGGSAGFFGCYAISYQNLNNNFTFIASTLGGTPPYTYSWSFGDGSTGAFLGAAHTYKWSGSYPLTLRVEDAEHNVCESSCVLVVGDDKSSCAANAFVTHTGSKNISLNGVKIQFTDPSNIVLRSDSITQPPESYFEITNSQPYAANENGEAGQLLTVRFNVLVGTGNRKVWLKSDNTTLAVAYK